MWRHLGGKKETPEDQALYVSRYWLACSASEIYAARSSIVGSIGVIGGGFGFVEVAEKIGVRNITWNIYLSFFSKCLE